MYIELAEFCTKLHWSKPVLIKSIIPVDPFQHFQVTTTQPVTALIHHLYTNSSYVISSDTYTKRLEFLAIDSLEMCRLHYDLFFVNKMLFGFVDLKYYFTLRAGSTTRGHDYKLFLAYSRLNVCKHFFCKRVVPTWNNL